LLEVAGVDMSEPAPIERALASYRDRTEELAAELE